MEHSINMKKLKGFFFQIGSAVGDLTPIQFLKKDQRLQKNNII